MRRPERITMRPQELDRLRTARAFVDGGLGVARGAVHLGITERWLRRVLARYRTEGLPGLVSRLRSRPEPVENFV